jgi:hypothetical protein
MFHMPMSSPMMTTMLGLSAAFAGGAVTNAAVAIIAIAKKSNRPFMTSSVIVT